MCGFAGIIAWDDRYRVRREVLERMSASLAHRGPDGEGLYINHEDEICPDRPQVGLAFRRLAIIDPDPRSNQPFTDGRYFLVFNGEIYNYRELRGELSQIDDSYPWRTTGDTEVLLRAYAVWGEKCVEHLNGMFAFAVWDEREKSLFLARDRMGQKPLYFASHTGRAVAFASELSAIRSLPWPQLDISWSAIAHYLAFGYVRAPFTPYSGIGKLHQGHWSLSSKRGVLRRRYFDPNDSTSVVTEGNRVIATRERVTAAVQRQLVADVPIGCFLSGGADSSTIAAAMRASVQPGQPVLTFSIGFADRRYDETTFAAAVAKHLGTEHRAFVVKPDAATDLPRLASVFGEPFGDSSALPMHYLARETRQFVKVALSGDGGDELFGGYDRYRAMYWAARLALLPSPMRELASVDVWQALPGRHPKSLSTRFKRFAKTLRQSPANRYADYMRLLDDALLGDLWPERQRGPGISWLERTYRRFRNDRDDVETALAVDRITYLPEDLLTKLDRASMLHGLEVRSPFMDHELVQFAAGLTTDELLKGGPKRMLREAFAADLPDFVFKRKKMGFAVPIGEWFRGELRPMLRDNLFASDSFAKQHFNMPVVQRLVDEHEEFRVDHSQRLYALLMLELWWRTQSSPAP